MFYTRDLLAVSSEDDQREGPVDALSKTVPRGEEERCFIPVISL